MPNGTEFSFPLYFVLFIFYSVGGWVLEEIYCTIIDTIKFHKLSIPNRGFLNGPLCPIYGVAAISMALALTPISHSYFLLFFVGMFVCDIVEYLTSFLMEKLFHARWWDYSNNLLNINGRICLWHSFMWGCLSIFFMKVVHPFVLSIFANFSHRAIMIAFVILLALFLYDLAMACVTTINIRSVQSKLYKIKAAFSSFDPDLPLKRADIPQYVSDLHFYFENLKTKSGRARLKHLRYEYPEIFDRMMEEIEEIQSVPHEFKKEIVFLQLDLLSFFNEKQDQYIKEMY